MAEVLKVVVDTNIIFGAVRGVRPNVEIIERIEDGTLNLFVSERIIQEVVRTSGRKDLDSGPFDPIQIARIKNILSMGFLVLNTSGYAVVGRLLPEDMGDSKFIITALLARAKLVSDDHHITDPVLVRNLSSEGVQVFSAYQFYIQYLATN